MPESIVHNLDCMIGMREFPDKLLDIQVGKAGEYLVCADLILKGFIAYPSEQGLPYDVVLDNGRRLLKIQVKTTSQPRIVPQRTKTYKAYVFNTKRRGKWGKSTYSANDVDLFALVALDTRKIAYIKAPDLKRTLIMRVDELRGTYYDEKGIRDFEKAIELKGKHSQTKIAELLGLHVAQVNRFFKDGYKPHHSKAPYFSNYTRSHDWIRSL